MKLNIHKLQCVIREDEMLERLKSALDVVTVENRGSLYTVTVRGRREEIEAFMEELSPVFFELLPLSLEEIFISETEVKGYDVKALLF
jgi:ABC-2 type transport system ATP-binding protein